MLTRQDYDVLLEAMEAWEQKDAGQQIMSAMLNNVLSKGAPPHEKERMERETREENSRRLQDAKTRKERSVVLRAKIIAIRDSIDADRIFEEAKKQNSL